MAGQRQRRNPNHAMPDSLSILCMIMSFITHSRDHDRMTGTTAPTPPQRRPAIRAVSFDEADAAIGRLLAIAMPATRAAETGASAKVADFLLAWWNGEECGHFPVLHLCNVDAVIAEDMLTIMAYLAQESTTYADAWGYRDAMGDLWVRYRGDPDEAV